MSGKLVSPRKTPRRTRSSTLAANSPLPASTKEKRIEQLLGPEWTKEEINIFFNALKTNAGRTDWERISSDLPGRTADMVRGLYIMHKEYLALEEATALGFFTIVKTVYTRFPEFLTTNEDVTTLQRGKGKARVATTPKAAQPKTPVSKQVELEKKTPNKGGVGTPSKWIPDELAEPRNRSTRKQLFPDHPNSTRRATGLTNISYNSTSLTPSKKRKGNSKSSDDSPPQTPTRFSSSNPASTPDSQLPLKLRGKALKGKISPGKGLFSDQLGGSSFIETPVAHTTIHNRLQKFLTQQSKSAIQPQAGLALSPAGRWAVYEWFYADVDRPFFQQNEFQDCLNELDLGKVRKLTRLEWSHVRSSMGKPRRLSPAFLNQERTKLSRTRINIRRIRAGENLSGESNPPDIPPKLVQGSSVIAVHNRFIKRGIVHQCAEDGSQYVVQLDGSPFPEAMKDVDLMTAIPEEYEADITSTPIGIKDPKRRKPDAPATGSRIQPRKFSTEELRNVARLYSLLERKEAYLGELTLMHNQAEKMLAQSQEYPAWFQQRYAVLIVRLEEVNQQLEPALLRLHAARSSPAPVNYAEFDVTPIKGNLNYAFASEPQPHASWVASKVNECLNQARTIVAEHQAQYSNITPSMKEYIMKCLALLLQVSTCAEHMHVQGSETSESELTYLLDSALDAVQPKAVENQQIFAEIAQSVNSLKGAILASKDVDV